MRYPNKVFLIDVGDDIVWHDEPDPNGDGLKSMQYVKLNNADIKMINEALRISSVLKNKKSKEKKFLRRFERILKAGGND